MQHTRLYGTAYKSGYLASLLPRLRLPWPLVDKCYQYTIAQFAPALPPRHSSVVSSKRLSSSSGVEGLLLARGRASLASEALGVAYVSCVEGPLFGPSK